MSMSALKRQNWHWPGRNFNRRPSDPHYTLWWIMNILVLIRNCYGESPHHAGPVDRGTRGQQHKFIFNPSSSLTRPNSYENLWSSHKLYEAAKKVYRRWWRVKCLQIDASTRVQMHKSSGAWPALIFSLINYLRHGIWYKTEPSPISCDHPPHTMMMGSQNLYSTKKNIYVLSWT